MPEPRARVAVTCPEPVCSGAVAWGRKCRALFGTGRFKMLDRPPVK